MQDRHGGADLRVWFFPTDTKSPRTVAHNPSDQSPTRTGPSRPGRGRCGLNSTVPSLHADRLIGPALFANAEAESKG
ncbi:uncharacterized protein LMH87_008883 [Akanthomyces muscarius]|uniref:Uncharacterized protein n=1 Tax=Akanthomyces muscarius TaxID=2231603 RepID=A0A9W8QI31_AKAMU|nr:uncharacterized protein LMH87_008883 [Akanthomyces muscarius]KAJ4158353.1 hypothetical protein LMH87_008883 [Akanthomyces muscarius]